MSLKGTSGRRHCAASSTRHYRREPLLEPICIFTRRIEIGWFPLGTAETVAVVYKPDLVVTTEKQISLVTINVRNPCIESVNSANVVPIGETAFHGVGCAA